MGEARGQFMNFKVTSSMQLYYWWQDFMEAALLYGDAWDAPWSCGVLSQWHSQQLWAVPGGGGRKQCFGATTASII